MTTFKEFMKEKKLISKVNILEIALIGGLFGCILMYLFMLSGLIL